MRCAAVRRWWWNRCRSREPFSTSTTSRLLQSCCSLELALICRGGSLSWCMGWAPTIFFTGLWIIICGHLNLTWHLLFGFSFQLLLDNAPLSFDWIWDTIFPLGFLTTSIRHPDISASRTRLTSTTSRSQFRGQKYCLSACIALTLAFGQPSYHCSASAGVRVSLWACATRDRSLHTP